MFRWCFGRACKKSPSPPRSTQPNLPPELKAHIANLLGKNKTALNTRALFSRIMNKTHRAKLPIGLAVLNVGPRPVPRTRYPVINRSRAAAKAPRLRMSTNIIDKYFPIAYKNNAWRFYSPVYVGGRFGYFLFFNTRNGQPFLINKKTGQRKNVPLRYGVIHPAEHRIWPRKNIHTWNAYMKRLTKNIPMKQVGKLIQKYVHGDRTALDRVSLEMLIRWINHDKRMAGTLYNKRNGVWYSINRGREINRADVLENINLAYG